VLANASLVITSTANDIDAQYGLYNYYDPARMTVIPPGTNLERFYPPSPGDSFDFARQVDRFLVKPDKPLILALSRPDERKNLLALIEAFGESRSLQQAANLLIVAGNRDDIRDLGSGARAVLTKILLLSDSYDLYGRIARPRRRSSLPAAAGFLLAGRNELGPARGSGYPPCRGRRDRLHSSLCRTPALE